VSVKYHAAVAMYVFISTLAPVLMQPFMLLSANTSISFTRSPNSLTKVTINQDSLNSKTNSEIVKYFVDTALPQLPESKHNVQQKLYQLQTLVVECTDSDALNAAAKHLQNAITAMKALQQNAQVKQILPVKRVFVANQNHEKQKHFFSTKKRKVSKNDWANPTFEERIQGKAKLKSLDTKYCAVCFEEDDHCNQDVVNWIQCSQCTMWVHSACSPQSDTQFYDEFICKYCKQRNLTDK